MTAAERILIEAEADAAEAKAKRLRQALGNVVALPAPARSRPKATPRPKGPRRPSREELERAGRTVQDAAVDRYLDGTGRLVKAG
jgi:hypothetical protein